MVPGNEQIQLTITPTEKRDAFDDVIYDIVLIDNGHPGAAEGSRVSLNSVVTSNLKAMLTLLDKKPQSKLTIEFTLEGA